MRRGFKSIIKKANILKIVSGRLGHADVRITLDTYGHLLLSMQRDTAIKFGKMLFDEGDKNNIKINLD
ncbi:integrase [Bacillus wiedmannii]|nr:integrase [Bacillus wiedmannii]